MTATNLRVSEKLLSDLSDLAEKRRWSRNQMIEHILETYVRRAQATATAKKASK